MARIRFMHILLVLVAVVTATERSVNTAPVAQYIIGGFPVRTPGVWPWQVSVQNLQSHICGGSLIGSTWVVTSAHCISGLFAFYTVLIGMHDRQGRQYGDPQAYSIKRVIKHPEWEYNGFKGYPNNIALLELDKPAHVESDFVGTIALADEERSLDGHECVITGWGSTDGVIPSHPDELHEAPVEETPRDVCQNIWGYMPILDSHLCAGLNSTASCTSDSGGPLACLVDNHWTLVGVSSWGRSDCSINYPSVYSRVSYYRDWIRSETGI